MYAVIRLRGLVKVRKDIKDTLKMLRLNRKMHCVLLNENDVVKGMLQKVKDWTTWGEIDDNILKLLIEKRGRKPGNNPLRMTRIQSLTLPTLISSRILAKPSPLSSK